MPPCDLERSRLVEKDALLQAQEQGAEEKLKGVETRLAERQATERPVAERVATARHQEEGAAGEA
jgi:hypothetical protein